MEGNIKEIDMTKLSELKKEIEAKEKELFNEINKALGNNDEESYRYLKQLQLQCNAELRLIKHIESNFTNSFIIC